ncbi:zinc-binding dehydrogenase [Enterococcus sp. ALS3]|uniref:Zinc-binding dehydrogenase n=1 Tax=Enterococcus alishanensis TaxID=1303817 RepID=A0ABS6TD88_9ENTE|nr:zinc-binding dehydrogenase [Enterococcus alishanensis]MBV7390869.1 zinc-binding dehydrogenase [Enterococcus alishanensis]
MKALYFDHFGNSDVLTYGELPDPVVSRSELLLGMEYIGLNYADIYRRKGEYHIEERSPYINGYEGVGTVIDIGSAVSEYNIGDKVFFVDVPFSNAELVAVPKENAIKLPSNMDSKLVASIGLQGLTADFLAHDLGNGLESSNVFVHGISGGVGQILAQMLTADGLNVYGITSSKEKQQMALEQGAKRVFLRNSDWQEDYLSYFDTVYDGVGITLLDSIDLVKHRGKVVFFGMAGGNPPKIDFVELLSQSKSILTGDLWDYLTSYKERSERSDRLFKYFREGTINISEPTIFSLSNGKEAHEFLESGKSVGKILLEP